MKKLFLGISILSIYSFFCQTMDIKEIDPKTIESTHTKDHTKWTFQLSALFPNIVHEITLTHHYKNDKVTGLFMVRDKRTNQITYIIPLGDSSYTYWQAIQAMPTDNIKKMSRTS